MLFSSSAYILERRRRGDGALVTAIERTQFSVGEFRGDAGGRLWWTAVAQRHLDALFR